MSLAGIDVGGTFTDIAVWDSESGTVRVHKLLTTPDDPTRAAIQGLKEASLPVSAVVHGTTLITNAIIERRGASTGLITTEGYRDTLEIGSELRYDTFDLSLQRPQPLVPRPLRLPVSERLAANGAVVLELDEAAVETATRRLAEAGVEAVAVAFFNSYRNPVHERRALDILRRVAPQLTACASADIAAEIREYERFSTAVANAYVQPLASRYLLRLAELAGVPLLVMLSDGGITTAADAAARPIALVESGPAAGAMVAAHLAQAGSWENAIAFDMGGTTAKISLIQEGVPHRTHDLEVARLQRFKKGSGLPLRLPAVDLIEIGAGGGSIAWADDLGLLKVGPRSAGASPGPACYGQGGREATVTDADLFLGYLSAENFLGGRLPLNRTAAEAALDRLADRLRITREAAAVGIVEVVNNNMATAARIHIAEQGRDARSFRLIAFGGAGPVHAYGLARLLHIQELVFPRAAGVASALGMLVSPRSVEYTGSQLTPLERLNWEQVAATLGELERRARALMSEAGVEPGDVRLELSTDVRYVGQGYEVTVPLADGLLERRDTAELHSAFEAEYRRRFDRSLGDLAAEVVSWRLRAISSPTVPSVDLAGFTDGQATARIGERPVYFAETGFQPAPVYARSRLRPGDSIRGPAVIEESESTVVAGPGAHLDVDAKGNLMMRSDTP